VLFKKIRVFVQQPAARIEDLHHPLHHSPFLDNLCCKNKPDADNDEHATVNKRRECIQRCTMHAERQAMKKRVEEHPV
jgi:hypothetical protein